MRGKLNCNAPGKMVLSQPEPFPAAVAKAELVLQHSPVPVADLGEDGDVVSAQRFCLPGRACLSKT